MVECESRSDRLASVPGINSFNRYMVECEYKLLAREDVKEYSFNRYMVECEFFSHFEP